MLFLGLSAAEYLIRKSGDRRLRRVFCRLHRIVGVLLIVAGVVHGVLAGNPADASLGDVTPAPVLFTLNWGTLSLVAAILLAASYVLRKMLRRRWMTAHRVLTVTLIALVALHVSDVGIQLGDRLRSIGYAETMSADASPTGSDSGDALSAAADSASPALVEASLVDEAEAMFSGATLADGVYEGSASGFRGVVTVSVTVSGGAVTGVTVVDESDTPSYFSRAETVTDTIVEQQSLDVDAVSGATYSSAGIVNAVADALSAAVTGGTLDVRAFTYSGHGGHGH